MRSIFFPALALLALTCVAHPAHAQVHRCIGANGEPVFTDQPCGAAGSSSSGASANGIAPAAATAPSSLGGDASAACPASPQALRDRIAAAFAGRDPNLIAGMIDWRGYDRDGATARLRDFAHWLQQPLTGIRFEGPPDPSGAQSGDADYAPPSPTGVTVTTQPRGDETATTRSFGISKSGGCWWLGF
ncbi:MAG: DUF4124 domain-containing protein [Proteobacteria bacterium]|nr:DUF4124 domain-containing protein [Pseudomonadota bacterium]